MQSAHVVVNSAITQLNLKLSCYVASLSLLFRKKSRDFFRGGEAAKIVRAVVLTAAYKFELASTMAGSVKKAFSGSFFALKSCRVVQRRYAA